MKLSVIIPVFNEEKTIEKILEKVFKEKTVDEVVAVNDGSSDRTLLLLNKAKIKYKKLKVISHKKNLGKGFAIKTGILNAASEYIIIQDADLEYNPEEFDRLLELTNSHKVIYGSRMMGKNPHAYISTYFGNLLLTGICNILFFTKLTDIYTCYKLIPKNIIKSLNISSRGFEIEAEITAKLLKMGIDIIEVPITYKPRTYKNGKKIKAIDAIKGIFTLAKIRFGFN
jgi:dolichol-phosphate mannosyltransferase